MKKFTYIILALMALVGCVEQAEQEAPYFRLYDSNMNLICDLDGGQNVSLDLKYNAYQSVADGSILASKRFFVLSNVAWSLTTEDEILDEWIRPFPAKGQDEGSFVFTVKANKDLLEERSVRYAITAGDQVLDNVIDIKQAHAANTLSLERTSYPVGKEGSGEYVIPVKANVMWEAKVVDNAGGSISWAAITGTHDTESYFDDIILSVQPNPGNTRKAVLILNCIDDSSLSKSAEIIQKGELTKESNLYLYEPFSPAGQEIATTNVADYTGWVKQGLGARTVTYTAGKSSTYTSNVRSTAISKDFNNPLIDEEPASAGANVYISADIGHGNQWFRINNISVGAEEWMTFGCALYYATGTSAAAAATAPVVVSYKFNNQNFWTELKKVVIQAGWKWYTLPAFPVPKGATSLSIEINAVYSLYHMRIDDLTVVSGNHFIETYTMPVDDGSTGEDAQLKVPGTYVKVNSLDELTPGRYLIVEDDKLKHVFDGTDNHPNCVEFEFDEDLNIRKNEKIALCDMELMERGKTASGEQLYALKVCYGSNRNTFIYCNIGDTARLYFAADPDEKPLFIRQDNGGNINIICNELYLSHRLKSGSSPVDRFRFFNLSGGKRKDGDLPIALYKFVAD